MVEKRGIKEKLEILSPPLVLELEGRIGSHFEGILVLHKTVHQIFEFWNTSEVMTSESSKT